VSAALDDALERKLPRDVVFAVREWKARHQERHDEFRAEAERAVSTVGPQPILETILSREWENRGKTRWSRQLQEIEDTLLRGARAAGTLDQKLQTLDGMLEQIQQDLGRRTTHRQVRQELLGGDAAGPGAIPRLREELQRLRRGKRPGGSAPEMSEATFDTVEHWLDLLQDPSESGEDEQVPGRELPGQYRALPATAMETVFWLLRARQKPDFCVQREALLDLVVPPEEVYDGWFVGEEAPPAAGPSAAPAAVPGDRVGKRRVKRSKP
jgi:hypothetical protein